MAKTKNDNPNDKIDKGLSNVEVDIAKIKNLLTDIGTSVYGTGINSNNNVKVDVDINATLDKDGNKTVENVGTDDFINRISSVFNKNDKDTQQKLEQLKQDLSENGSMSSFSHLLNSNTSYINKYEDLMIITKVIPQLGDAIDAIVDSILSPDDLTKIVALNVEVNGAPIVQDEIFNGKFKNIYRKYDLNKKQKEIIRKAVILGRQHVAVIPYKDAYANLINNKNKTKKSGTFKMNESMTLEDIDDSIKSYNSQYHSLYESLNSFYDDFEESTDEDKVLNAEYVKHLADIEINYGIGSLSEIQSMEVLKEVASQEKAKQSSQNLSYMGDDEFKKSAKRYSNIKTTNDGTISTNTKIEEVNPTDLSGLSGGIVKVLDERNVLPLKINDTCLGYYYIETNESSKILRNNQMRLRNGIDKNKVTNKIDAIYKQMGELLLSKLDKNFILQNQDIKEKMYEVLKFNELFEKDLKITYIPADQVIEYEINNGESVLENVLFFAKLYLALLLTGIMLKVSRSNDIRVYNVKTDANGGVNSQVNYAIENVKTDKKSIMSLNRLSTIISDYTRFTDLVLPYTDGGDKPIDFDIIQGQDIEVKSDLIDLLEQIIVNGTGVPLEIIQNSNEVDFARTYTMLNTKFLKRILSFQIDLNTPTTLFNKAVARTEMETDEDKAKCETMIVTMQSPMGLTLNNTLDEINNAKDLAQSLATVRLGENNQDVILLDKVTYKIIKMYTPNVDWNKIDDIVEESRREIAADKVDQPASDEDGEESGY